MGAIYNNVQLAHVLTEQHETTGEPDPSNTDITLYRTSLRLQAVLSPSDYPAAVGETPAATAARITHLLCTPRRPLAYTVGNTTVLNVPNGDDKNGPWPDQGAFSIREVTEGSFIVTFAVIVHRRICTGADSRGFLSLKWTDAVGYAADWTCTRTRSGLLITSRKLRSPDDLRHVVTPAVPAGFRREAARYEMSEDGLRLRFDFAERQLHKALPWPATKVGGFQVETVPMNGGMRRGELSLRLNAPPATDPRALFGAAVAVGMSRVYASSPNVDKTAKRIMVGCGVRESLSDDETAVEISLQWMISPPTNRANGVADRAAGAGRGALIGGAIGAGPGGILGIPGIVVGGIAGGVAGGRQTGSLENKTPEGRPQAAVPTLAGWLGQPLAGANPDAGVAPPTRGVDKAAYLKLVAAALYDPCGSTAALGSSLADNYMVGTAPGGGTTELRTGPAAAPAEETVYAEDAAGIWEHWLMRYSFTTDSGYGVIPATKQDAAGEMVRFGNPRKRLRVEWELKRTGDAPPLPEPKVPQPGGYTGDGTLDDNWVGLRNTTTYDNVDVAADGVSFVYTAAGVTEWDALDATKAGEAYPCPPWLRPAARPARGAVALPPAAPAEGQLPSPPQNTSTLQGVQNLSIPGVPPPDRP